MSLTIPKAALEQHTAIIGKTGSGKTSTAKGIIEGLVETGARVCILDPIKSDWWGLTSSASGLAAGLPFHILGGPRGHVPLHAGAGAAIAELVANGDLPLSIIDMADFAPGGQSQFFVDFAPALLRRMRGVVYLVLEEAHIFAPKERSGIGVENMSIHWAKMLATAGRSKGIRLIPITQRVQALHNAVLGSCDTLIAHRLTAPADQDPVLKWLKANVDKALATEIGASLSSLKTGTGWLCSGEAKVFQKVAFPPISTFDNSATPTDSMELQEVKTVEVDREKLRTIIGTAVQIAESNDPKKLKARIAELERRSTAAVDTSHLFTHSQVQEIVNNELAQARADLAAYTGIATQFSALRKAMSDIFQLSVSAMDAADSSPPPAQKIVSEIKPQQVARTTSNPVVKTSSTPKEPDGSLDGPQKRVLNAIAWWESTGIQGPYSRIQIAFIAGYKPGAGAFNNPVGKLKSKGLLEFPGDGLLAITEAGRLLTDTITDPVSTELLHQKILDRLDGPQQKIFRIAAAAYPRSIDRESLATQSGYTPGAGAFNNPVGKLKSLGLVVYPEKGYVQADAALFLEGAP